MVMMEILTTMVMMIALPFAVTLMILVLVLVMMMQAVTVFIVNKCLGWCVRADVSCCGDDDGTIIDLFTMFSVVLLVIMVFPRGFHPPGPPGSCRELLLRVRLNPVPKPK